MTLFDTDQDLKSADAPGRGATGEPIHHDPVEGEQAPSNGVAPSRAPFGAISHPHDDGTVLIFRSFGELGEWWERNARPEAAS